MIKEEINTALRKIAILAMSEDHTEYDANIELIIRQLVKLGVVGIEDGHYVFEFDEVEGYEVREAKRAMLQPQERPKGRWEFDHLIHMGNGEYNVFYKCSNCGREVNKPEPFCHCGADMRESE